MKVSVQTVKQYTDVDLSVEELVAKINSQLGGVEGVIDLGSRYKDALIVRVVRAQKHPNADKLNVCLIDDGQRNDAVPRNDDGLVQVVCGAPNVHDGMFAVWLPPASMVPSTAEDTEPFILGARELRGVLSQGMLASPKELGLGDSHEGILELTESDLPPQSNAKLVTGSSFSEVFGLNDTIIDIENKMFTHRPDCFGQLGVAREIAGIQHKQFTSPRWYSEKPQDPNGDGLALTVRNEAPDAVPRFMVVGLQDITVRQSPVWLQAALVRMGAKPINNVVDATNYIMLLTGQPTHAYDYDKLRGGTLLARMGQDGEKVTLLNHKTYELTASDIVIADGEGPVGLAGIMGGGDSEVSDDTTSVVLECANFDMYTVRKSSMRHGVFTDALARFNKGQSTLQNPYVLGLLIETISQVAGGRVATGTYDEPVEAAEPAAVAVSAQFINDRLGLELTEEEIATLLENVEFTVASDLEVTPPYWRTDIELPEDVVEEVGRLYGFDKLPRILPSRSISPAPLDNEIALKRRIRSSLANAGANEVLTYSFVHEKLMTRAGQDPTHAFKLSNALSPDLQYYRYSPQVSVLEKIHMNIKAGHGEFALFEIGKGHDKNQRDDNGLPLEPTTLEVVYASKQAKQGAAFYQTRRFVEQLADDLGITLNYVTLVDAPAPYETARSAMVSDATGNAIGTIGELRANIRRNLKLPDYCAAASLDISALLTAVTLQGPVYRPLSRFPSVTQDISLKVASTVPYASVAEVTQKVVAVQASELEVALTPLAIYQPDNKETKTITLRLKVTSQQETLTDSAVHELIVAISTLAASELSAETV